ncbi:MAG: hypothetical protein GEU79_19180 [Acidimicrobiia bacterium]|nr:hypothetical protein [Acidimicrobiia bacterium]
MPVTGIRSRGKGCSRAGMTLGVVMVLAACGSDVTSTPTTVVEPTAATTTVAAATDSQAPTTTSPPTTTSTSPTETTMRTWPREEVERADPSIFDYDPVRPVEYEVVSTHDFSGYEMQRIRFHSGVGGDAFGYLALPVGEPIDGVGVLWGHGIPADGQDSWVPMSIFACAGVTSIVVDAPYARPGGNMGEPFAFTDQDREEQIQLVVDMRRAVDILADLGAERYGFGGISYGASIGGQLIGVDHRIEAAVLLLGDGGVVERFFDEEGLPGWPLSQRSVEEIDAWREAMLPIEPSLYIGDSPAEIFFMNATGDPVIPAAEAERYQASGPPGSEVNWMEIDAHDIPFADMTIHDRWLGDRLGVDGDRLDDCLNEIFPNGWDDL